MVYALNTLEEFSAGLEKLENTDASTNVNLSQDLCCGVYETQNIFEYHLEMYEYCRSVVLQMLYIMENLFIGNFLGYDSEIWHCGIVFLSAYLFKTFQNESSKLANVVLSFSYVVFRS